MTAQNDSSPEKFIRMVGWAASIAATLMFLAYIDQIRLNLLGQKGSIVQPAATIINCLLWLTYGAARKIKDWPIIVANVPGIVLGVAALLTAL